MTTWALALALWAAPSHAAPPADAAWRAALDLLYDGQTDAAFLRLSELQKEHPDDPYGPYLQVLALCWKLEQRPGSPALDREMLAQSDRALKTLDARLEVSPHDVRTRLARGAVRGVRSRFHLFRTQGANAAREAARMREDLAIVRIEDPGNGEARFGMGVYDYYVDVLPRVARILRFLARMPAGSRTRGLAEIEEARDKAYLHRTEVQVQLYEIYSYYEDRPDAALREIRDLRARYPGSPLWALKLAEHLRVRLGHYTEAAAVAREILEAAKKGHPNYASPAVLALGGIALGEAFLLDGRTAEARRALLQVKDGAPGAPALAGQARFLLGRALELEGDREGALAHYRAAAASPDKEMRKRAEAALDHPLAPGEVQGRHALAEARRLREAGQAKQALERYREAHAAWPESAEARLALAEEELRAGRASAALQLKPDLGSDKPQDPGWLRAWSWLLRARAHDLEGARTPALALYKKVHEQPHARSDLKDAATAGLKAPYRASPATAATPSTHRRR